MTHQDDKIIKMMEKHFEDDKEAFEKITQNFQKFTDKANEDGQHMSYFNKNLLEFKKEMTAILHAQDETSKIHRDRIEPMILAYENSKKARAYIDEKGESVVKWSVRIGAFGIIGGAIMWLIRKSL